MPTQADFEPVLKTQISVMILLVHCVPAWGWWEGSSARPQQRDLMLVLDGAQRIVSPCSSPAKDGGRGGFIRMPTRA